MTGLIRQDNRWPHHQSDTVSKSGPCIVICDPNKPDMPAIFASYAFCELTGNSHSSLHHLRFGQDIPSRKPWEGTFDSCKEKQLTERRWLTSHFNLFWLSMVLMAGRKDKKIGGFYARDSHCTAQLSKGQEALLEPLVR